MNVTRRGFIKGMGAMVGASSAAPALFGCSTAAIA